MESQNSREEGRKGGREEERKGDFKSTTEEIAGDSHCCSGVHGRHGGTWAG
jgi:hypothetical protein